MLFYITFNQFGCWHSMETLENEVKSKQIPTIPLSLSLHFSLTHTLTSYEAGIPSHNLKHYNFFKPYNKPHELGFIISILQGKSNIEITNQSEFTYLYWYTIFL